MKSKRKTVLYGLAVWVIPFVAAVRILPLRSSDRVLFESLITLALSAGTVVAAIAHFQKQEKGLCGTGLCWAPPG